eukprot:TRINITY_DN1367_c0_g1_i1.p1 TRINITY_DN1367_c0_g1~~TRINITY_DN1367_c0_g1_i1.p1  ORF type:complete len:562 (+),score=195.26 TRINITY_DN1367_c0_g1_i1:42-1727(+)
MGSNSNKKKTLKMIIDLLDAAPTPQEFRKVIYFRNERGTQSFVLNLEPNLDAEVVRARIAEQYALQARGEFILRTSDGKLVPVEHYGNLQHLVQYMIMARPLEMEESYIWEQKLHEVKTERAPDTFWETETAIAILKVGCALLKLSSGGDHRYRHFFVTTDGSRIAWYSSSKELEESSIAFRDVTEVRKGCRSSLFQEEIERFGKSEHLCFSLVYTKEGDTRTLDLVAKHEREIDLWLIGLKALHSDATGRAVSKMTLFSHSRVFNAAMREKKIEESTEFVRDGLRRTPNDVIAIFNAIDVSTVTMEILKTAFMKIQKLLVELESKFKNESRLRREARIVYGQSLQEFEEERTEGAPKGKLMEDERWHLVQLTKSARARQSILEEILIIGDAAPRNSAETFPTENAPTLKMKLSQKIEILPFEKENIPQTSNDVDDFWSFSTKEKPKKVKEDQVGWDWFDFGQKNTQEKSQKKPWQKGRPELEVIAEVLVRKAKDSKDTEEMKKMISDLYFELWVLEIDVANLRIIIDRLVSLEDGTITSRLKGILGEIPTVSNLFDSIFD